MQLRSIATAIGAAVFIAGIGFGIVRAAPAESPQDRALAAYQAMGFSDQYKGEGFRAPDMLVTLITKGSMQQWDPGESYSVADLLTPDGGSSTFVLDWDHARGLMRTEWTRPKAGGGMRTYTEIFSPDGGYVIGNDSNGPLTARAIQGPNNQPLHSMSSLRLRALLREQERNSIVLAMHENPERLYDYPAQTVGGKRYEAVQYRGDNGTFIVMFDPITKLPAIVRTRDFDQLMGDADFDAAFSDYRAVEGIKLPYRVTYTLNGVKIFDTTVTSYAMNPSLASDAFTVPAVIRGKAAKPAPVGKVPYQWILRRLASGFYLDSEALYTDDGTGMQLTDVAPNVSLVTGSTHNTLIVATNNSLIAFEAPGDDGQSQIAINLAKQKYPGKPFRYLVLTHHHIDHSGGLRAYAAEGATIVVGKGDGAFFRKVLAAPHGMDPFPLKAYAPKVIEVADKWSVNEGGREIDAFVLENPHAAGYLIPYVPDAKLGFVTDLWNPGPPVMNVNPGMVSVVTGVQKMGIQQEKFAGGHGAVGNYADLVQAVRRNGGR
jgi:glyoxylase-like metal-dependent hydrolase (beta-lactamase superfamily II)